MLNNGASDDSSGSGSGGGGNGTTLKKGPWTAAEDAILMEYVKKHGEGNWNAVQKNSGLSRCGKSCRLRWANHLRPNLKKGSFSPEEERLILELHSKLGNKWARMAAQLPGRTDNEIKNYWNTRVKRRQRAGLPLYPHDIQKQASNFHHHQNNQQHQHQHHHPRVSQSPSPQLSLASSQQQKPNFMTPLSIYDPINFSNTMPLLSHQTSSPFLSSPSQGYKRFRDNNAGGFSNSFTLPTTSLTQSTMFNQSLFPSSNLQFSSSNYELNPSSLLQSQFEHNGVMASGSSFIKSELPSYQSSLPISNSSPMGGSHEYKISSFARSNSGLLDALLLESDVMGGREDGRKEGLTSHHDSKAELNDFLSNGPRQFFNEGISALPLGSRSHWDEASSTPLPGGVKLKKESTEEIDSVEDDDLSSLLDIIPTTMMVSDLYHESAETSNGQSSGVTEEEVGLDLRPLPPCSFPDSTPGNTATGDQDWTIGNWSTVPEMC